MKNEIQPNSIVVQRLNELITTKHLSKADMARIAGVSRSSVHGWFQRGSISKDAASKLAASTGVSLVWLLGENDENSGLSRGEKKILDLFRQFPPSEQQLMISAFEMRLKELKDFIDRYLKK